MALALLSPSATPAAHRLSLRPLASPPPARTTATTSAGLALLSSSLGSCFLQRVGAAGSSDGAGSPATQGAGWLDAVLLRRVSGAADADQALEIVAESAAVAGAGAALDAPECNAIVAAAFDRGNVDLALSVFEAMRSGFAGVGGLRWARPDVRTYALLVQRLAAALRVSDAIGIIDYVCRAGVSSTEEVPFGMIVRCPTCMIAVAVAQPQDGTQVVSCSKCRCQYELFSGDITTIQSEEVRISSCRTQHGYFSSGKGIEIYKCNERWSSSCCPLYCGRFPFKKYKYALIYVNVW